MPIQPNTAGWGRAFVGNNLSHASTETAMDQFVNNLNMRCYEYQHAVGSPAGDQAMEMMSILYQVCLLKTFVITAGQVSNNSGH